MSALRRLDEICRTSNHFSKIIIKRSKRPSVKVLKDGTLSVCIPDDIFDGKTMTRYDLLTISDRCAEFDEHVVKPGSEIECTKYQMLICGGSLHVDIKESKTQLAFT